MPKTDTVNWVNFIIDDISAILFTKHYANTLYVVYM